RIGGIASRQRRQAFSDLGRHQPLHAREDWHALSHFQRRQLYLFHMAPSSHTCCCAWEKLIFDQKSASPRHNNILFLLSEKSHAQQAQNDGGDNGPGGSRGDVFRWPGRLRGQIIDLWLIQQQKERVQPTVQNRLILAIQTCLVH